MTPARRRRSSVSHRQWSRCHRSAQLATTPPSRSGAGPGIPKQASRRSISLTLKPRVSFCNLTRELAPIGPFVKGGAVLLLCAGHGGCRLCRKVNSSLCGLCVSRYSGPEGLLREVLQCCLVHVPGVWCLCHFSVLHQAPDVHQMDVVLGIGVDCRCRQRHAPALPSSAQVPWPGYKKLAASK